MDVLCQAGQLAGMGGNYFKVTYRVPGVQR